MNSRARALSQPRVCVYFERGNTLCSYGLVSFAANALVCTSEFHCTCISSLSHSFITLYVVCKKKGSEYMHYHMHHRITYYCFIIIQYYIDNDKQGVPRTCYAEPYFQC